MKADNMEFEFPTLISGASSSSALENDIVFCGKVMKHGQWEAHSPQEANHSLLLKSQSLVKSNTDGLLKPFPGGNRCRRSTSCRKYRNGLFGILKFPVEMDLSDIKMRQARREPAPPPKLPESINGDGGSSCWEMVRPLRQRGPLMSALVKATFGCIPPL